MAFNFKESAYKFTDPVRLFKANDPYYWEVDNIPLRQLQENDNWIRDQLSNIDNLISIDRKNFTELRPYVAGDDRNVRVKPGRFSARINDGRVDKHQFIERVAGGTFGEVDTFRVPAAKDGDYTDAAGNNLNSLIFKGS